MADDDERGEFDVAVVVFVRCRAVDRIDAGHIGEAVVREALVDAAEKRAMPLVVPVPRHLPGETATVAGVMDLGVACGNGYLWTSPTLKAYREAGMVPDGD